MADEIRRWSDELASDPSSLVFLQLSETLRRQGQIEIALKIALRGLERHPNNIDAHDLVARIAVDQRDFARAYEELCRELVAKGTTRELLDRFMPFDDVNELLGKTALERLV